MLFYFGWVRPFTADDVLEAEKEDALRDHRTLVDAVAANAEERRNGNAKLRTALSTAMVNAAQLSSFEHAIRAPRSERQHGVHRSH